MANAKFHTTYKPPHVTKRKYDGKYIVWQWLPIEDYYNWHITGVYDDRRDAVATLSRSKVA